MNIIFTRDEVKAILEEHCVKYGEVKNVRITPTGNYLAAVIVQKQPEQPYPIPVIDPMSLLIGSEKASDSEGGES